MTDNEIKKALECCVKSLSSDSCNECPLNTTKECDKDLLAIEKYSLDLINRLQADVENYKQIAEHQQSVTLDRGFEIKRLKEKIERLERITRTMVGEIKAEAYTEFAERLETEYAKGMNWFKKKESYYVDVGDIDNLVKEMVGEDK